MPLSWVHGVGDARCQNSTGGCNQNNLTGCWGSPMVSTLTLAHPPSPALESPRPLFPWDAVRIAPPVYKCVGRAGAAEHEDHGDRRLLSPGQSGSSRRDSAQTAKGRGWYRGAAPPSRHSGSSLGHLIKMHGKLPHDHWSILVSIGFNSRVS